METVSEYSKIHGIRIFSLFYTNDQGEDKQVTGTECPSYHQAQVLRYDRVCNGENFDGERVCETSIDEKRLAVLRQNIRQFKYFT